MEMKIGRSFYILEIHAKEKDTLLYDNLDEAIKKVAHYLKNGIESDSLLLSEIDVKEDQLVVKGIPWSTIAEKLIKSSK